MWAEIKKNTIGITTYSIQKRPDNEFVYLKVCLRFDFTNLSVAVRTALPPKCFLFRYLAHHFYCNKRDGSDH